MTRGEAPNHSELVAAKLRGLYQAQTALAQALEAEYPKGAAVRVVHYRGEFNGTVHHHDRFGGCRVWVKNDKTGKVGKWSYSCVELT